MEQNAVSESDIKETVEDTKQIVEGSALIRTKGKVFYNPVQEFNRDISISAVTAFAKIYENETENQTRNNKKKKGTEDNITITIDSGKPDKLTGVRCENGITILEALSATGLRSIRYAKEIPGVKSIIANDISPRAVIDIKYNVGYNGVADLVVPSQKDANLLMYEHSKENQFDVIDLDPYGCPSIFLDSAVQAVKKGGLLLVTATDMAVLAGNSPEACYSKYGAVSLKIRCCHEMAIRILLQCIESHANRYGRYIVPLLSVSADFYIRVFVRVYTGAHKCKFTTSKLSYVYHCTGCDSFELQPLGILETSKKDNKTVKFKLPTGPRVSQKCEHCGHSYHIGGPIWTAPIHSHEFAQEVLCLAPKNLNTSRRIEGILTVILEELLDVPLYYAIERLCSTLHLETPSLVTLRSAFLNAGYRVSYTHMKRNSLKTDAPSQVVWDIMRCWHKLHPASRKYAEGTPAYNILLKEPEKEYSFDKHPDANPKSRKSGVLRFQENPLPFWGPGSRATAMVGEQKMQKSRKNQCKRKRGLSQEDQK